MYVFSPLSPLCVCCVFCAVWACMLRTTNPTQRSYSHQHRLYTEHCHPLRSHTDVTYLPSTRRHRTVAHSLVVISYTMIVFCVTFFSAWHSYIVVVSSLNCRLLLCAHAPCGARAPLFPLVHLLPHLFPLLLFPFFHWLYLFSSFVHPFPFYQNSPTPFPGRRS